MHNNTVQDLEVGAVKVWKIKRHLGNSIILNSCIPPIRVMTNSDHLKNNLEVEFFTRFMLNHA